MLSPNLKRNHSKYLHISFNFITSLVGRLSERRLRNSPERDIECHNRPKNAVHFSDIGIEMKLQLQDAAYAGYQSKSEECEKQLLFLLQILGHLNSLPYLSIDL